MHLKEAIDKIKKNVDKLFYTSDYDYNKKDSPYKAKNLENLRATIENLEDVEIINNEITNLKKSGLFASRKDEMYFTNQEDATIKSNIAVINNGFKLLTRMYESNIADDDDLYIKLPELENFDDLSKISNELKRAIEIPVNEQGKGGHIKIKSAEPGSIWLLISLGAFAAVNLIGAICWAAAVIRKKNAEAKIFEEHAKTLELKNESLRIFVDAQKTQIENILESEAQQILNGHFDSENPETLQKIKLSINTVSDLIDKGTQIIPASDTAEVKKSFPDYSNLNLIESTIKMLNNNNIS